MMPKRSSTRKKRPRDVNQLAKSVVDEALGDTDDESVAQSNSVDDGKNPAAVELGRLGGLKGGKARAAKLSKKRRSEIAAKAAAARWSKKKKNHTPE